MGALLRRIRRAFLLARLMVAECDLDWAKRHAPDLIVTKRKAVWRAEQTLLSHEARHPVRISMDALVVIVSAGGALPFLIIDIARKFA